MSNFRFSLSLFFSLFLLIILPGSAALAHSEGGTLQVADAPAGPYVVSVWTNPPLLKAGNIHFTVLVSDAARQTPVTDARVLVELVPAGSDKPLATSATIGAPAADGEFRYEATVPAERIGPYQVRVKVSGVDTTEEVTFHIQVRSAISHQILITILALHVLLTAVWLLWEGRITWRGGLLRLSRSTNFAEQ